MNQVALITGASSGIGRATAVLLAQNGYTVYGAARRVDRLAELEQYGIHFMAMDLTDDASVVNGIQKVLAIEGKIDILVNAAGFGCYGAIEDVPMKDARVQLEVNLIGPARLIQLALPSMRQNRYGKIVNVSSIGGKIATPFGGWYHASKFGMEGWSDALRNEVRPFGIDVMLIEPGGIRSEWAGIAFDGLRKASENSAYREWAERVAKVFESNEDKHRDPSCIAGLILKSVRAKKPKARYRAGYLAHTSIAVRNILPDRWMDILLRMVFYG